MGIFARCKDILASNLNYNKAKKNPEDAQKMLNRVKAQALAYETNFSRVEAEVLGLENDIDKYNRYLERVSGSQAKIIQNKLDDANAKVVVLKEKVVVMEKQCLVLKATVKHMEADVAGGSVSNDPELQRAIDVAASLAELDAPDAELEALMSKYD